VKATLVSEFPYLNNYTIELPNILLYREFERENAIKTNRLLQGLILTEL